MVHVLRSGNNIVVQDETFRVIVVTTDEVKQLMEDLKAVVEGRKYVGASYDAS